MSDARAELVMSLFAAARERPAEERAPFVLREAGDDAELAAEVLSLLRHDSPTEDLLGLQARAAAAALIDADPAAASATIRAVVAAPEEPAPERIGRFRVLRALGRGGFGRVYLAEQDEPRRLVAVKVAHAQASPTDRRRFRAEGEALARLQHPGIARVFDAGVWRECGDRPYIVMEYIEGLALDDYAAAHALSRRRRMALLAQVCDAVAHAHRRGVIHRDLAPKNILVGEDGAPRILDFGVARLMDPGGASVTLARDGSSLVGTLGYMSPEQLSGDPLLIDTRTDVYALGVIAYELLTGRRRLDVSQMTLTAALEAARTAPAARPSSVDRSLRGDLDAIVLHATERDPEGRYPSANALGADLRRWLRGEPVLAHAPSALYRARKFALRHRTATAAAAILAVGLTVAAVYAMDARRAEREAHAASLNALDAIVTRLLSPLASKLGSLDERSELLAIIGPDVERIASGSPTSPKALQLRARYLSALGDIDVSRGDGVSALQKWEASLAIHRRLAAATPGEPEYVHECSLAIVRVGDLLCALGRHDEGRRQYEEALSLDEAEAAKRPDDARALSNLYWSYRRLDAVYERSDRAMSRELLRRAAEVSRELVRRAPGAWRTLEADLETHRRRAQLALADGEIDVAADHGRDAAGTAARLAALDPDSAHLQRAFLNAYQSAIAPLVQAQRLDEADLIVNDAATELRSILGAEPGSLRRLTAERMLLKLRMTIATERADDALREQLLTESIALSAGLMTLTPNDPDPYEWRLDALLSRLQLLQCRGRQPEALGDWRRIALHLDELERRFASGPQTAALVSASRAQADRALRGEWWTVPEPGPRGLESASR